ITSQDQKTKTQPDPTHAHGSRMPSFRRTGKAVRSLEFWFVSGGGLRELQRVALRPAAVVPGPTCSGRASLTRERITHGVGQGPFEHAVVSVQPHGIA